MGIFDFISNPVSTVMNVVDDMARLKGSITGEANRWVDANSRDEPPMAQDYYPHRKHQNSNIIPSGYSNIHTQERTAYIACRLVGGGAFDGQLAQAWNVATAGSNNKAPNPDHHWVVVVGDYLHQLQATSLINGDNYYTNEIFDVHSGGWKIFPISTTAYNDVAIRNAATEVMNGMDETYNILNNNCQTFSLRLLDRIGTKGRQVQLQGNRTFGLMKSPVMELKPSDLRITRINEDGTETEVGTDLQPLSEEKKQPTVDVVEIAHEDTEDLNAEAKARFDVLLDAMRIMDRETPVLEAATA